MDERRGRIGVCSWSLGASTPGELAERVRAVGVECLQLGLEPLRSGAWELARVREALAGLTVCSGMMGMRGENYATLESIRRTGGVRLDEHWDHNRRAASEIGQLARELGLDLVSFHAGFLPERRGVERTKLIGRLREIVDRLTEHGVRAAFETGQETAETLAHFLEELARPSAGVNFDPANMILYDMGDPVEALGPLARWIRQVHVKDARRTKQPGTWGEEVRVGSGEVRWEEFFGTLNALGTDVDLVIEREAGEERIEDIRAARELVERTRHARLAPKPPPVETVRASAAVAAPAVVESAPSIASAVTAPAAIEPEAPRDSAAEPEPPDATSVVESPVAALGVGILGFGYMGRTHAAAYRLASQQGFPNRVVALCDRELARLAGSDPARGNLQARGARDVELGAARAYLDPAELLADPAIELVSVCTPTDTHVELALAALAAGKHVLVEKPVALRARDVKRLAGAARKARRVCMPAMCMRFWPGWTWLRERVKDRSLGRVQSAVFRRLGTRPAWSPEFYADLERSGGALFDLHVHDADFVRWCFGVPDEVVTAGSLEHVTTFYRYAGGPAHVVAEGGWDHAPGFPFFMGFTVVFERGTAEFALGRNPPLLLARDGATQPVTLDPGTGYDGEVRHVLEVCARRQRPAVTLQDAVGLVAMLEAEKKSLQTSRPVKLRV